MLCYVRVKVIVESSYSYVEVCLHHRDHVSFIHAVVKCHNVVVVAKQPLDFGFHKDVWYDVGQVICRDLLAPVQHIGL